MLRICVFIILLQMKMTHSDIIQFSVKENSKIGTVVGNLYARLSMKPNSSKLELIKPDPNSVNYFSLNKESGDLVVGVLIDRETICEERKDDRCFLTLHVDRDIDMLRIRVKIDDVNDNAPLFLSTQANIKIQENIPIGTTYILPVAQDKDTSMNGINNYSISAFRSIDNKNREKFTSQEKYFRIEGSQSPQLKVVGVLDREEISMFVFLFVASDFGQLTGSCTMTIVVTDVNDNVPEWKKDNYKVTIRECQDHGEILEFDATDRDDSSTANGRVSYRISDRTPSREKISRIFYINGNKLYLSNNRATELSHNGVVMIFVHAVDGNGRMKEACVEVTVEDCNDQPPVILIDKRYGEIMENKRDKVILTIVHVKDGDRGRNGQFECGLNDTSHLSLDRKLTDISENNIIYKLATNGDSVFDRELEPVYVVEIKCTDRGDPPKSNSQRFTINILDQNDNSPKFEERINIFHVQENNPIGSTIGYVRANDLDYGANGLVRYSIVGGSDHFMVGIHGEIQSKISFDRETRDSYEFVLLAKDCGSTSLNDTITVKVVITDENDCKPVFAEDYFFKITESYGEMMKADQIGRVNATDRDYGSNGSIQYTISSVKTQSASGTFQSDARFQKILRINSAGWISIYGNLDREAISTIQLVVEAQDNGRPRLSTQTTVTVEILDLNDNAPVFIFPIKKNGRLNISLDSEIGVCVGTVSAKDPDLGANGTVYYTLVGGRKPSDSELRLEEDGRIIINSDLSKLAKYRRLSEILTVKASDGGVPPKSQTEQLFVVYYDASGVPPHQPSARRFTNSPTFHNKSLGQKNRIYKYNNDNYGANATISDSMMLLYCLAAILFFVFIIVFSVLLYIYCSKVYTNSERYSKKPYQSSNFQMDRKHNMKELQQIVGSKDELHDTQSGKNEDGATVSFVNDDGSSYTHLMMLGYNKYTPMIHPQTPRQSLSRHGISSQSEMRSVSQNFFDTIIDNSQFQPASPPVYKASVNGPYPNALMNGPANYSTLQDKANFNSMKRKDNIQTLSSPSKRYSPEISQHCQQEKNFNSSYVTSSFV